MGMFGFRKTGKRDALRLGACGVLLLALGAWAGPVDMGGKLTVGETGSATYQVPLQLLPSIGTLSPNLSLVYDSHSGDGLLGVGWNVSGLSSISRCARTPAQDGVRGRVGYDINDRYCLDGKRLMLVSGQEGKDGAEYRTEIETFSKITAVGTAGNGPAYFLVKTRDGRTVEYGNSADSRLEVSAKSTVRVWGQNRISDSKGNYYTLAYDNTSSMLEISHIDYTGNANPKAQAGENVTPANTVQFNYETRPDVFSGYANAIPIKRQHRLASITLSTDGEAVRQYVLSYVLGKTSKRSLLASVKTCSAGANPVCLPGINILRQDGGGFAPSKTSNIGTFNEPPYVYPEYAAYSVDRYLMGDVNGDGRQDLFYVIEGQGAIRWSVRVGHSDGSFSSSPDSSCSVPNFVYPNDAFSPGRDKPQPLSGQEYALVDVNGDGLLDLVWAWTHPTGGLGTTIWLGQPNGTISCTKNSYLVRNTPSLGQQGGVKKFIQDINGDGLADVVLVSGPSRVEVGGMVAVSIASRAIFLGLRNGSFSATPNSMDSINIQQTYFPGQMVNEQSSQIADVNGDGIADLVQVYTVNTGWVRFTWLGQGNGSFSASPIISPIDSGLFPSKSSGHQFLLGDVNGDGIPDLVGVCFVNGGYIYQTVLLGLGNGAFSTQASFTQQMNFGSAPWKQFSLTDVNGDGMADLVLMASGQGSFSRIVWLATGGGAFSSATFSASGENIPFRGGWYTSFMGQTTDVDGDGLADIVTAMSTPRTEGNIMGAIWVYKGQGLVPDLVTSIQDGSATDAKVVYGSLVDPTVYAKGSGSVYPRQELQIPLTVVKSAATSDGLGGTQASTYKYGGLRAEIGTGRGLLGYNWVEQTQTATGIVSRTTYRQDWPYIGQPSQVKRSLAGAGNAGVLSQHDMSYVCADPKAQGACTVAAGKRYFVAANKVVEAGWDLNGAVLPSITRSYDYDCLVAGGTCFGNVLTESISYSDGFGQITSTSYRNDTANWLLGLPLSRTVTKTAP